MPKPKPTPKIWSQIDNSQFVDFYDLGNRYQYTFQDMAAVKWFVRQNMDILSGLSAPENLESDPRVEVDWSVPKLSSKPVVSVFLDFTYIAKYPKNGDKGIRASYYSYLKRVDEQHNWYRAEIDCSRVTELPFFDMAQFSAQDFQELGLSFSRKYFLKDLPRSEQAKHSDSFGPPDDVSDADVYSVISKNNFAFYEMTAHQNGQKLKLTFVVSRKRELENAESGLPLAWHKLYIERVD